MGFSYLKFRAFTLSNLALSCASIPAAADEEVQRFDEMYSCSFDATSTSEDNYQQPIFVLYVDKAKGMSQSFSNGEGRSEYTVRGGNVLTFIRPMKDGSSVFTTIYFLDDIQHADGDPVFRAVMSRHMVARILANSRPDMEYSQTSGICTLG